MSWVDSYPALDYANKLLGDLDEAALVPTHAEDHPALRWAQSGAMSLTGEREGPPQMCPVPLASQADGGVAALNSLSVNSALSGLDGAQLLGERAALTLYRRAGATSAGGGCRLLPVADGWLALNLARTDDWEVLPAWLGMGNISNWEAVADALSSRLLCECVAEGRLLGLAVAAMDQPKRQVVPWYKKVRLNDSQRPLCRSTPLVVDLSSLWAGPLCTNLLQQLGARVVKVESTTRPDGLRQGGGSFFDLLNGGKASVALDFTSPAGREQLRQLLLRADIVVEASRPRALRQLGIFAEEIVAEKRGVTWISISGYGRELAAANWIAFGDDAGVAAGLSRLVWDCTGRPLFCADAIADPLTGIHAALVAWSSYLQGGGCVVSLALADVITHCIQSAGLADDAAARTRIAAWNTCIAARDIALPRSRLITSKARFLGADTVEVLSDLSISC